MHTRGRVIFIWASWLWVENCADPQQDGKTQNKPKIESVHPTLKRGTWADVIRVPPEASRHVCIMSMRPGPGSSVAKLNNLSRNMQIIWDKSRILRRNRTNDSALSTSMRCTGRICISPKNLHNSLLYSNGLPWTLIDSFHWTIYDLSDFTPWCSQHPKQIQRAKLGTSVAMCCTPFIDYVFSGQE